ncbi:MAG TPA: DUF177 domain-containing protein [Casimicrobiaceae bacterium]|nr:DUF177 domain-containing protein [Casimicrobiaceae bacterium]
MVSRGKRSAGRFDAFRLAAEQGVAEGNVDAHALPRIANLLSDGPATIGWRIEGFTDVSGRPALRIALKGAVSLTCQRCLADFVWPVDHATEVLLAHDEEEVAALDAVSSLEVVHASGPTDPLALVEDELLLTLPFAPRHPEGACDGTIIQ